MKQIVKLGFFLALVLCIHDALGQAWQPQPKQATVVSWQSAELQHNLGDVARQQRVTRLTDPKPTVTVRWTLDDNGHVVKSWVIHRPLFQNPDIWLYSEPGGGVTEAKK
jgi:hypothetical protein